MVCERVFVAVYQESHFWTRDVFESIGTLDLILHKKIQFLDFMGGCKCIPAQIIQFAYVINSVCYMYVMVIWYGMLR